MKTSERAASRLSRVFEPPNLAVPGEAVSQAEMEFFKKQGFLFKRGLIDKTSARAAMNRIWPNLLERIHLASDVGRTLKRDDPSTWRAPQWKKLPPADTSGPFEGRQRIAVHGRTVKMHDIGDQEFLLKLVPNNKRVRSVARMLLGEHLQPSRRTRGVYAIFPPAHLSGEEIERHINGSQLGPHTDRVCQQLNVCAYLEDVQPRSGGFTVYPGSHRIMFNAHRFEANWSPTETFDDAMRYVVANIEPVEFVGKQGDTVFWHGRTVHSSGIHVGDAIRWAVFADFTEAREVLDADTHRKLGLYEWFKDAKLFKDDFEVGEDMWRSWRMGR